MVAVKYGIRVVKNLVIFWVEAQDTRVMARRGLGLIGETVDGMKIMSLDRPQLSVVTNAIYLRGRTKVRDNQPSVRYMKTHADAMCFAVRVRRALTAFNRDAKKVMARRLKGRRW
jgi:hypothetical protein